MPFVSPADSALIASRIARLLVDTCDIWDGASPRARAIPGVPCQVVALSDPTIASAADRGETVVVWRILLPAGTDVRPDWQVRMDAATATPALAGRIFVVRGDLPGSGERVRRVIAAEAQ